MCEARFALYEHRKTRGDRTNASVPAGALVPADRRDFCCRSLPDDATPKPDGIFRKDRSQNRVFSILLVTELKSRWPLSPTLADHDLTLVQAIIAHAEDRLRCLQPNRQKQVHPTRA